MVARKEEPMTDAQRDAERDFIEHLREEGREVEPLDTGGFLLYGEPLSREDVIEMTERIRRRRRHGAS